MHPEVRQVGPGSCPICGMALEPETVTLDDKPDPELIDMTRRFWISVVLTLPLVVLDMGQHLSGRHWLDTQLSQSRIQLMLATPVVVWAGWPFFVRGWQSRRLAQSEHVHADRARHRRRVGLQPRRHRRAATLSTGLSRCARRRCRLLRGGRGHHHAGAARSGSRAAGAGTHVRRDQGAARPQAGDRTPRDATGATKTSRSKPWRPAICCACGPARRCRSTASLLKGALRSTNCWSPAN